MEEAQQRLQTTLEQVPNFSLEFAKEKMFYMKKQDQVDLYLKGLQSAGAGPWVLVAHLRAVGIESKWLWVFIKKMKSKG